MINKLPVSVDTTNNMDTNKLLHATLCHRSLQGFHTAKHALRRA
jgi:hypothetical protein